MKVLILSHIDADGICSARIIYLFHKKLGDKITVKFREWNKFGLESSDVKWIKKLKPDLFYLLDLGSKRDTVDVCLDISNFCKVCLIDHHPSDIKPSEIASQNFSFIRSYENCTTGLAYNYIRSQEFKPTMWMDIWTILGIYGDVCEEKTDAKKIIDELKPKYPKLFWSIIYFKGGRETKYEIVRLYSRYFNTARRLGYHQGAYLAFLAMEEIESKGLSLLENLLELSEFTDKKLEVDSPYTSLLKYWFNEWIEMRREVFRSENIRYVDVGRFNLAIINHPWDIGGWVASIKAQASNKPCFVINYGVPDDKYAKITGRNLSPDYDVGSVLDVVGSIYEGKIFGGGHKEACSGLVRRDLSIEEIIRCLLDGFRVLYGEETGGSMEGDQE